MIVCNVLVFGADQVLTGPAVELRFRCFDPEEAASLSRVSTELSCCPLLMWYFKQEGGGSSDVSLLVVQEKWKVISKSVQERGLSSSKASKANLSLSNKS